MSKKAQRLALLLLAGIAAGLGTTVVEAPAAQAAAEVPDLFWVRPAGASGVPGGTTRVEVHALDGATTYNSWSMHAPSSATGADNAQWKFVIGDANADDIPDLYALNVKANKGQNTNIHVFDGKTRYTTTLVNQVLPDIGAASDTNRYRFFAADLDADGRDDLYAVDASGGHTAVHVFDAGDRFESFLSHRILPGIGAADLNRWQFAGGDIDGDNRADIYMIDGGDTTSKTTAVHVTSAKNGYTVAETNRVLPGFQNTPYNRFRFSVADYDGDGKGDVYGIDSQSGGGTNTAVHIITAGSGFTTGIHRPTAMGAFNLTQDPVLTAWAPTTRVSTDVTLADLQAIYGTLPNADTIARGLPTLNAQMRAAGITTPRRKAAFLATLLNESVFRYNAVQAGATSPYRGRGYIQLTGEANYRSAGNDLGHNFVANPDDAASIDWSAAIARWYWTVARDINPMADRLDMGAVNKAIGYAPNAPEDAERCADFKAALNYFLGAVPSGVKCAR